jgi:hypothetical protein
LCRNSAGFRVKLTTQPGGFSRKRHIRCDEAKPACNNCVRSRRACGGYFIRPRKNQSTRNADLWGVLSSGESSERGFSLSCGPDLNSLDFKDDLESLYFEQWCHLAKTRLSGYAKTKLWTVFLPQVSRKSAILRHAAIAIGAQSLSIENADNPTHQRRAVSNYCRALRLQAEAQDDKLDIQEVMLSSALFICFEVLRSGYRAALQHLAHGTVLLHDLLSVSRTNPLLSKLAADPWELVHELLKLYMLLGLQRQTVFTSRLGLNEPLAAAHAAAHAASRGTQTQAQTQTQMQTPPREQDQEREQSHEEGISKIARSEVLDKNVDYFIDPRQRLPVHRHPERFTSVLEANQFWFVVQRDVQSYAPRILEVIDTMRLQDLHTADEIDAFFDAMDQHPLMLEFVSSAKSYVDVWYRAFKPLYYGAASKHKFEPDVHVPLVYLRFQYVGALLDLEFPHQGNLAVIRSLTPLFKEALDICEVLARSELGDRRGPKMQFSMQSGLLWRLLFVALICRDAATRDRARRILQQYPHREGLWDSRAFLAVAERSRTIEMENALEGSPEEQWRRLCRRAFRFEDAGCQVVLRSVRKVNKAWEVIEEVADLRQLNFRSCSNLDWKRMPLTWSGLILQWGRTTDAPRDPSTMSAGCVSLDVTLENR